MLNLLRPYHARLRKLAKMPGADFFGSKAERIELAPAEDMQFPPAIFLPGQLDRIRGTAFASHEEALHIMTRTTPAHEPPILRWQLRNVDLIDGVLYHNGGEYHLQNRKRRFGLGTSPKTEISQGAICETWTTNRWFGSWLMDSTLTHQLMDAQDNFVSTQSSAQPDTHRARYEDLLGMHPTALQGDTHFKELVLFDDLANSSNKIARAHKMRQQLLGNRAVQSHPGVYLWRGSSGDQRLLINEAEIAERLEAEHGFIVIDPMRSSVDELLDACAGARAVIGVEGSHLVHGINVAPAGAAIIPIQPPDRVTLTLKLIADRLSQRFALLVAEGNSLRFRLNWADLGATMDLLERN